MLNLSFSRRSFLRVGGLAAGGLTLADLLRLKAHATAPTRNKAIIFVYLFGGPSHVDSYDMKPDAPAEYRGEFGTTRTNVTGFDICDLMPLQATIADRLALVRNLTFNPNFHDPVELFCGFKKPTEAGVAVRPDFGSVVSRRRQGERHYLPKYVALDQTVGQTFRNGPAYLGLAHKAFIVRDNLDNFSLNRSVDVNRLHERTSLLREFDAMSRELETARGDLESMDHFNAQALEMVTNPRVRDAFDVSREPQRLRDRYGVGSALRLLQARRLVEAGVPVVTLTFGEEERDCILGMTARSWDTHNGNFNCLRTMLPRLDRAVHTLVTDLHERGLTDDVLVYVGGEMGRTPRVGQGTGNGAGPDGRDHWPRAGFGLFAGGGLRMGQVVGRTDRYGSAVVGVPYEWHLVFANTFQDITFGFVSWFHEAIIGFGSAFLAARFKTIGSISDAVGRDGIEQLLVEKIAERRVALALEGNHGLKRFQRLNCALETDRARVDAMFACGLSDDRPDEIVGQDVRPDFLADQLGRFAPQDVHLHRLLQRAQVKLGVPARAIKLRQVVFGNLATVQQRRDDDDRLGAKANLLDAHTSFPNCEELRKRVIRFSIHRTRLRGLGPLDDVIVLSETFATSKISSALAQACY